MTHIKSPRPPELEPLGEPLCYKSLFEKADSLTLKVRCYPQTCHLVQKKLLFFFFFRLLQIEHKRENLGVIFELFVLCLLFDRTISFLCKLQSRQGS